MAPILSHIDVDYAKRHPANSASESTCKSEGKRDRGQAKRQEL